MTTYRDQVWEDSKEEVVPLVEEEVADCLQEEDVATVGHRIRVQTRIGATTVQPRLNSKTISIELVPLVRRVIM